MDVSRTKICPDTFISPTSNSGRSDYLTILVSAYLMIDDAKQAHWPLSMCINPACSQHPEERGWLLGGVQWDAKEVGRASKKEETKCLSAVRRISEAQFLPYFPVGLFDRFRYIHIISFVLPLSTCRRMISIDRALKSLVYGSFKVTLVYAAAAAAFSGSGLEA